MRIETLVVGSLQTNCYLVADEDTQEAMIVDPGADEETILKTVERLKLQVRYVVNTHAHFDHMLANKPVLEALVARQASPPELVAHAQAVPLLQQSGGASWFGFPAVPSPLPDRQVGEGDILTVGGLSFQVMHTPGHSPGSISLYCRQENALLDGDVLFRLGVGRADLPGGSWHTLESTIRSRLFALPDHTVVYPGHGPPTTIGEEKRNNPFVSG